MVGLLCGSLCGACLLATAAGDKLGPGDGAWEREAPELHGLDSRKLDEAARLLDREVPQRYCFAVARNGKLVYEAYNEKDVRYPGQKNTENTRYEVDSAGKTMQAMMVGVGVTKKLYDLDTPIEKYGVKPQASFGPIWNREEFYHDLTLRHILSQTTGQGKAKPGTAFTYDSDAYVAHASHLIETVSGQGSAEWATENFAVPMGLPDLYKEDGDHTDIGGGQMMSCTDMLKVGQLVLNKGKWKEMAKEGGSKVVQLVSEEYTKELMKPQHPQFLKNYGLLTWLNTESGPGIADCCSAQWCQRWSGATDPNGRIPGSAYLPEQMLGKGSPPDAAIAVGWLGRTMIIVPSRNLVTITLGSTWGAGQACDDGNGYSEEFTAGSIWNMVAKALDPSPVNHIPINGTYPKSPPADPPCGGEPSRPKDPETGKPFKPAKGSCKCYCPPDEGFGQCFPADSEEECYGFLDHSDARKCTPVGVIRECSTGLVPFKHTACDELAIQDGTAWDQCTKKPCIECTARTVCPDYVEPMPWEPGSSSEGGTGKGVGEPALATSSCQCSVIRYGSCSWSAEQCPETSLYQQPQPCVKEYHRAQHQSPNNANTCTEHFLATELMQAQTVCCADAANCMGGFPEECSEGCAKQVQVLAHGCSERQMVGQADVYVKAMRALRGVCGAGGN